MFIEQATGGFLAAQTVYFLQDRIFFKSSDASDTDMGKINSEILIAYNICQIFQSFLMGSLYEILGRRFTLLMFSFLVPFILALIPYTAPNVYLLAIMKVLCGFGFAAMKSNPLVADYIKNESRGSASAIKAMGLIFGQMGALLILL
jgi:MFS family permease